MMRPIVICIAASALWLGAACWSAYAAPGHAPEADAHAAADVGGGAVNPLTVDPDLAIFTAVVFLLLLAFLTKFAWRPIVDGLDKREGMVASQIAEAKQANERASELLREHESRLAAASGEVSQLLSRARRDAETVKEQIVAEAKAAAARERDRAVSDIEAAKNAALGEVAEKSADLAMNLAGKIVRKELNREDHRRLIQESLERFPSRN